MEQQETTVRPARSMLGIGLALLLATATFFSGLHIGTLQGNSSSQQASIFSSLFAYESDISTKADLTEFWRVWDLLDQKFAFSTSSPRLTEQEKIDGAIGGLVRAYGDPYTVYLPKEQAEMFGAEISGNFGGVGMEVGMRNNYITVIAPLPDTPAAKAGIEAGDVIAAVDGKSTDNMGVDEAVHLIRGEVGTTVVLKIARAGDKDFREISIVRDQIEVPTIKTETKDDVFVITLYSFNALAEMKMQQALREYVASGRSKLVLDLRGNPGGYLDGAVAIASYFLPAGKVVVRESFADKEEETIYRSSGKTLKEFAPTEMVVLIDGGSASASEILSGALSQHGYATLIGEDSFGKGSVQELMPLRSGASLKVTIARWLTPDGTSISDGGLKPNIVIERTFEDREAGKDPQMDVALQYLHGTYAPPLPENE